jgi:hypothetical protein
MKPAITKLIYIRWGGSIWDLKRGEGSEGREALGIGVLPNSKSIFNNDSVKKYDYNIDKKNANANANLTLESFLV